MYRKFTADHIFDGYRMHEAGYVLVMSREGIVQDIVPLADAGDDIEQYSGIFSPGFINAHCHLELSHMKGHIPTGTGMIDFILKVVNERHYSEEEIFAAIAAAEDKMLQAGIVAVGDICNNTLTIPQKKLQRLQYHNFIEVSGFTPAVAAIRFNRSYEIYKAYQTYFPATSLVPHAPYSVSPELFGMISETQSNAVITMHNQESLAEDEFFQNCSGDFVRLYNTMGIDIAFFRPSGKSGLQTVAPFFHHPASLILVHNVHTQQADISYMQSQNAAVYYCLCPNANLYITGNLPALELLLSNQCNIVLGTDSLASNHQLSILQEIKTLQQHFPSIPVTQLLQWATINGAKALQLDHLLGSFERNKRPGVLCLQLNNGTLLSQVQRLL